MKVYNGDLHQAHSFICPVCGRTHASTIQRALIEKGALAGLPGMIKDLSYGTRVLVVTDQIVYGLIGEKVKNLWEEEGLQLSWHIFKTPMLPDEKAIGEVFVAAGEGIDTFIALGGGSVCDVTRYVAFRLGIPLIPIPTAITHDGFFTDLSLLLIGGMKTTLTCMPPSAFLADIDVISGAPVRMNAAGLGEMASKYTALADWYAASLVNGEWFCDGIFDLMREAIDQAFAASDGVGKGDIDALLSLTDALYKSAVDMSWYGSARTGAGAEHHLTHYWVMRHAVRGEKPNMHGEEVGVGAVVIIDMWERMLAIDEKNFDVDAAVDKMMDKEQWTEHVKLGYGEAAPEAFKAQKNKNFSREDRRAEIVRILEALPLLREKLSYLPNYKEFALKLKNAGAPYLPSQLHVTREELIDSIVYAKEVRSKYTSLWIADALGLLPEFSVALADDIEELEKELA